MLIANDVSQAMGKSTNQITIITDDEELSFPEKEKLQVAEEIVQSLARHLDKPDL
jgi:phosphopantothenoylcysteine decarboxylase/phosphopantothenate--cysteine ligase